MVGWIIIWEGLVTIYESARHRVEHLRKQEMKKTENNVEKSRGRNTKTEGKSSLESSEVKVCCGPTSHTDLKNISQEWLTNLFK